MRLVIIINGDICRKSHENRQFSHPCVFHVIAEGGSPWNWVSARGSEETRMMGLPNGRKSLKIYSLAVLVQYRRVRDTQPATQLVSHVAVACTRYAYLRRAIKTQTFQQFIGHFRASWSH